MSNSNHAVPAQSLQRVTQSGPFEQRLQQAIALHQQGDLAAAKALYEQLLEAQPGHADALHLLGLIASRSFQFQRAFELISHAIERNPAAAVFYNNRGIALQGLRRLDEALADYDRALAIQPGLAQAHGNRGNVLVELGQIEAALVSYDQAVAIKPDWAEVWCKRGDALQKLNRVAEAVVSYGVAIAIQPDCAQAYVHRGICLQQLGRLDEALANYEKATAIHPGLAQAWYNRGVALQDVMRFEEALSCYSRAIEAEPGFAQAHHNRGNALRELHCLDEALASYDQAIAIQADYAEAYVDRGIALYRLKRLEDSLAHFDRALLIKPGFAETFYNRAIVLQDLNRLDEALKGYEQAVAIKPDFAKAHWNQSLLLLMRGDFSRGWPLYEWRFKTRETGLKARDYSKPLWRGEGSLQGKTILLYDEQGFGDTLQFCRYAKLVQQQGARVLLEAPRPLIKVLETLEGVDCLIESGQPLPAFDYHCPLLSLPLAFKTDLSSIPHDVPYLHADPAKAREWKARLGERTRLKVGVVWNGGHRPHQPEVWAINARRNIPLEVFARLLGPVEVDYVSLQKGDPAESEIAGRENAFWPQGNFYNFACALKDFSDTAALIANLDLVVSVDTAVAHLSGALGKPTWILNRFDSCWRWLLGRDDSPWYPHVKLYRQDATRAWDGVLAAVVRDLEQRIQGPRAGGGDEGGG